MKLTILEDQSLQLEQVFTALTLKTESGEMMSICMRDTGFEFIYQGNWYFAKEGRIEKSIGTKITAQLIIDEYNKVYDQTKSYE